MARSKKQATTNEMVATTYEAPIEGVSNAELLAQANRILTINSTVNRLDKQAQSLMLEAAYRLGEVKERQLFLGDGFKSINDFGSKVLGYKSNMISKMVAASKRMLNVIDEDGTYHVCTKFAQYDSDDSTTPIEDFGLTQLFELASTSDEAIIAGLCNGLITRDMSCAKLREFAKSLKGGSDDADTKKLTDGDTSDTSSNGGADSKSSDGGSSTPVVSDVSSTDNAATIEKATSTDYKRTFNDMSNEQLLEVIKCAVAVLKSRKFSVSKIAAIIRPTSAKTNAKGAKTTAKTDAKSDDKSDTKTDEVQSI